MAFSLSEKLAVAGAFCALVVLAVGTDEDPGIVVTGKERLQASGEQAAHKSGASPASDADRPWWQSTGPSPAAATGPAAAPRAPAPIPQIPVEPWLESAMPVEPGRA